MKLVKDNIRPLMLMLSMPIMSFTYLIINRLSTNAYDITLPIDHKIPLIKIFVIPYIIWYLFIPFSFIILCLRDKKTYYKTMLIYIVGSIVSSIIFITHQTTVPRTPVLGNDIFAKILIFIQSNDKPVNCLPSLHAFTSYLVMREMKKSSNSSIGISSITTITGVLIILSTLFTKQHAVLDVISGIILAEILIFVTDKFETRLYILSQKKLSWFFSSENTAKFD